MSTTLLFVRIDSRSQIIHIFHLGEINEVIRLFKILSVRWVNVDSQCDYVQYLILMA